MNTNEIAVTQMKLMDLKGTIIHRINLLDKDKRRIDNPMPRSMDDQAVAQENDSVVECLDKKERIELKNINDAIDRIKEGVFGICIACGTEIGTKRLNAVPYAKCCIECANK